MHIVYCEEEASSKALIAKWKDCIVYLNVEFGMDQENLLELPTLKSIYMPSHIDLQNAIPFLKANHSHITHLDIDLKDSDIFSDIDFELPCLQSLILYLESSQSFDLSPILAIARGITCLEITAEETVESVESLDDLLQVCAENLEHLVLKFECDLPMQLNCCAPKLDHLSLFLNNCEHGQLQLIEYGKRATTCQFNCTPVANFDPRYHTLPNVKHLVIYGMDIDRYHKIIGDKLETLEAKVFEKEDLKMFKTEKFSKLETFLFINECLRADSVQEGLHYVQNILQSCENTLKRLIICSHFLENCSELPVMRIRNLTDLYLDG